MENNFVICYYYKIVSYYTLNCSERSQVKSRESNLESIVFATWSSWKQ